MSGISGLSPDPPGEGVVSVPHLVLVEVLGEGHLDHDPVDRRVGGRGAMGGGTGKQEWLERIATQKK